MDLSLLYSLGDGISVIDPVRVSGPEASLPPLTPPTMGCVCNPPLHTQVNQTVSFNRVLLTPRLCTLQGEGLVQLFDQTADGLLEEDGKGGGNVNK